MNNKVTVIHTVGKLFKYSGVTDVILRSSSVIASEGHEVIVLAWDDYDSVDVNLFHDKVTVILLANQGSVFYKLWRYSKTLVKLVKTNRNTVIHNHGLWQESNISSGIVSKIYSVPLVISPHGMLESWSMNHNKYKKILPWFLYQRLLLKYAKYIHACSVIEKNNILKIISNADIWINTLGVCITPLQNKSASKNVLFFSRIHPKKGVMELVKTWKILDSTDWTLSIVGPGEEKYLKSINDYIKQNNMDGNVKVIGALYGEDKQDVFRKSSLFVLPTYSENFGIVVAEAFMERLPVITTNATPWVGLDKRGCGWTIHPTENDLLLTLQEAMKLEVAELNKMGEIGRDWMIDKFSWEVFGKKSLELYQKIISK